MEPSATLGEMQALMEREQFGLTRQLEGWRVYCTMTGISASATTLPEAYAILVKRREGAMAALAAEALRG